jgi:hypothetical protein
MVCRIGRSVFVLGQAISPLKEAGEEYLPEYKILLKRHSGNKRQGKIGSRRKRIIENRTGAGNSFL